MKLMPPVDLNLLAALDALLAEGSVTGAAARLGKSVPATSRLLARLRAAFDDPLFVRAGREYVPTARAIALRPQVGALIARAETLLKPQTFDPARLERRFVIRCGDDLAGIFGPLLAKTILPEAPGVSIVFAPEGDEDMSDLREGRVDADLGAPGALGVEAFTLTLLRDRFIGAARVDSPIFFESIDASRYAAAGHIASSRRGRARGPIDWALRALGLERRAPLVMASAGAALAAAEAGDLVASVPRSAALAAIRRGARLRLFDLPVETPPLTIALSWHPRGHDDPAHEWLRKRLRRAAASVDLAG
jgi:DNA-binding transcriptional LysR family regulator